MGMDVYGVDPDSKQGEYFRRNVWGWRPLWMMVEELAPALAGKVKGAQFNDGDGLDAKDAKELGKLLEEKINEGTATKLVDAYNLHKSNLPQENCFICEGTGVRTDAVGIQDGQHEKALAKEVAVVVGREFGWCNGCAGYGKKEHMDVSYGTSVECLKEFATFAYHSGGFEIF